MRIKIFLPIILLLFGCATYRTKLTIAEAKDVLSRSEKYDVREYAADQYDIALNNINSAEVMLKRGRTHEGLASAEAALVKARQAYDAAIRSHAALLLKKSRDALKIVDENNAVEANQTVYSSLMQSVAGAENAFKGERLDESISLSHDALFNSEILLNGIKKESEILLEMTRQKIKDYSGTEDKSRLNQKLREAEEHINAGQYARALTILQSLDNLVSK